MLRLCWSCCSFDFWRDREGSVPHFLFSLSQSEYNNALSSCGCEILLCLQYLSVWLANGWSLGKYISIYISFVSLASLLICCTISYNIMFLFLVFLGQVLSGCFPVCLWHHHRWVTSSSWDVQCCITHLHFSDVTTEHKETSCSLLSLAAAQRLLLMQILLHPHAPFTHKVSLLKR